MHSPRWGPERDGHEAQGRRPASEGDIGSHVPVKGQVVGQDCRVVRVIDRVDVDADDVVSSLGVKLTELDGDEM